MICFDVSRNDEHLFSAGMGENGTISAAIDWIKQPPGDFSGQNLTADQLAEFTKERLSITVGGTAKNEEGCLEQMQWIFDKLSVGDSVTIKIVDGEDPSPPEIFKAETEEERDERLAIENEQQDAFRNLEAEAAESNA